MIYMCVKSILIGAHHTCRPWFLNNCTHYKSRWMHGGESDAKGEVRKVKSDRNMSGYQTVGNLKQNEGMTKGRRTTARSFH